MEFNKQINPKDDKQAYSITLMPCRAGKIKKVESRNTTESVGGGTAVKSGLVIVPPGETSLDRTIRHHESMHAAHTKKFEAADLLDQALEDARLHRYCSNASKSEFQRVRRDELTVALRDLRQVCRRDTVTPASSLVTLRGMAILQAGETILAQHTKLLTATLSRFGPDALKNFQKAINLLKHASDSQDLKAWKQARQILKVYFKKDYSSDAPPVADIGSDSNSLEQSNQDRQQQIDSSEPDGVEDVSNDKSDTKQDDSENKKTGQQKPDGDSNEESNDNEIDGTGEDNEENADSSNSDTDNTTDSEMLAEPIESLKPARKKPVNPDEYTADLCPAFDREQFNRWSKKHPMKLMIRRLDMGINRVKINLGHHTPLPAASGRHIIARRLAFAVVNPNPRVFARSVSLGGYGTILIDASGSMSIPEQVLINFLDKAPGLTLGFYNAPNDECWTKHGSIFIYAANGYRASLQHISYLSCPSYGTGNMIDYHAMAWLIKQPSPHYLVTDCVWTGPWMEMANRLFRMLVDSQQIIHVQNLKAMEQVLEGLKHKR